MAVIGSAYVTIRAITDKLQGDIQKALDKAVASAGNTGAEAGRRFRDGFNGQVDGQLELDLDLNTGDLEDRARESSRRAARGAADEFERGGAGIERAAARAGQAAGASYARELLVGDQANQRAGAGMRRMVLQLDALLGVAGTAVGALASLASGLFSIGAAAAPALQALIVLPAVLGTAITGVVGLVLAFRGVSAAFKAGTQAATGAGAAASQSAARQADAARAIENAQRRVQEVVEQNAEASERAARRVEDSQRELGETYESVALAIQRAQRNVRDAEDDHTDALFEAQRAQDAVNAARLEAIETLEDLEFAVRRGAINEGEAVLALERAREKLAEMVELPPDHRLRRDAQLAYDNAILNLDVARERNDDLRKEQAAAAAAGVEGSREVVSAREEEAEAARRLLETQERLALAQQDLAREQRDGAREIADAQRDVSDAMVEQSRTARENARRMDDAQRAVADAMRSQAEAASAAAPAVDKFNQAMAKLPKSAQNFVNHLIAVRGEYKKISEAAAIGLFEHLIDASNTIVSSGVLDDIAAKMRLTTHEIGLIAVNLANLTKDPFFRGNLNTIMQQNVTSTHDLGNAIVSMTGYFVALFAAAQPLIDEFTFWIARLAASKQASLDSNEEMEEMRKKFVKAGEVAKQLGRIFGNLWAGIKSLGTAAAPAGQSLLDSFEKATKKLRELDDEVTQSKLAKYFQDVADNVREISSLLGDLGLDVLSLGDNSGIGETSRILREDFLPILKDLLETGIDEYGPMLAEALVSIAEAFKSLSEAGALDVFVSVLQAFAETVTWIMNTPVLRELATALIAFEAALAALVLIRNFSGIGQLIGLIGKLKGLGVRGLADELTELGDAADNPGGGGGDGADGDGNDGRDGDNGRNGGGPDGPDGDGRNGRDGDNGRNGSDRDRDGGKGGSDDNEIDKFRRNMKELARQFQLTGRAKDAFIRNLQVLAGQFGRTGASALGAGAGAGGRVGAAGGAAGVAATGGAAGAASKNIDNVGKAAGKNAGVFSRLGSGIAGLAAAFTGLNIAIGPVGWIIIGVVAALALIGAAIYLAYKKSEPFRESVQEKLLPALEKLKVSLQPIIDLIVKGFNLGLEGLGIVLGNVVIPALGWLIEAIALTIDWAIKFVSSFDDAWRLLVAGVKWAVEKGVQGFVILRDGIMDKITAVKNWITARFNDVVSFITGLPSRIAQGAGDLFGFMRTKISEAKDWVWNRINDVVGFITGLAGRVRNGLGDLFAPLREKAQAVKDWVTRKFDDLLGAIGGIFNRLPDSPMDAFRNLASNVNRWLIRPLNAVTSKFGLNIPEIPRFASGGYVSGAGGPKDDRIAAMLSNGEYVLKADTVKRVGRKTLDHVNKTGSLPTSRFGYGAMGGPFDWIGDVLDKGGDVLKQVAAKGASAVLDGVVGSFLSRRLSKDSWAGEAFHSFISSLKEKVRDWGRSRDEEAEAGGRVSGPIGNGPVVKPIASYRLTSGFGQRWGRLHAGVDMAAPIGQPVYAAAAGRVVRRSFDANGYGNWIEVQHAGWNSRYGHMNAFNKRMAVGLNVTPGTHIGWSGNTGGSTGPHLHFETRPGGRAVDPIEFMKRRGVRLATGGVAKATPGGIFANIAEAGRDEKVVPLDSEGLSAGDRKVIQAIREIGGASGGRPVQITINPPAEMDISTLAKLVAREIAWQM